MKFLNWKIQLALALIGASAGLYGLNYLIFRDTNYMLRLFLAQLGFLPISVLLVTIILNQLLAQRAKAAKLAKLNMVIGAFFSEVGGALLKTLSACDRRLPDFQQQVAHISHWTAPDFAGFSQGLAENDFHIEIKAGDLENLRDFLLKKRDFLLRLLENPNLLEHDSFSSLLLAVFHLTEELAQRTDLHRLSRLRSGAPGRATCSGATSCSSKSGWPTWRILRPATPISSPWPCAPTPSTPSPPRRLSRVVGFQVLGSGENRMEVQSNDIFLHMGDLVAALMRRLGCAQNGLGCEYRA